MTLTPYLSALDFCNLQFEILSLMSQDNGPTPMPSGDEAEAQSDLRGTINERRNQEVEVTKENIDSIILEASQTVAKEQDLR